MRALPQIRKASIQNAESICLCFHFQPSVEMGGTFFLTFSTEPELPAGNGEFKKKLAIFNVKSHLTAIVILNKNFHKLFISVLYRLPFPFSRFSVGNSCSSPKN